MTTTILDIHYQLTAKDEAVVSAIRAQSAPFKGKMTGPEARGEQQDQDCGGWALHG